MTEPTYTLTRDDINVMVDAAVFAWHRGKSWSECVDQFLSTLSPTTQAVREEREAFESWAVRDHRSVQPQEYEVRVDSNNHYYQDDCDNNAFIGWKAARECGASTEPHKCEMSGALVPPARECAP